MTDPQFTLIGLPTDINSSFERGAAQGPAAIRDALWSDRGNLAAENGFEIGSELIITDSGDLALSDTDVAADDILIRAAVEKALVSGTVPLCLGGDHAVTLPIIEAVVAHHGRVTILHFDAHPDTYHDFAGNPRSHASPFARIMEAGLASHLIQVGIRTITRHGRDQAERFGITVIDMASFTVEAVPQITTPTYISLDLDGLDPAFAPGVSHPEPGGLAVRDILKIIARVTGPIVGADIVELNPRRDNGGVTAIVAAKLLREIAALAVNNYRNRS